MAAPRRSCRRMNMLELAEATGLAHSAVSKKLAASSLEPVAGPAKAKVYDAPAALRVLLCSEELDPKRERARLDAATADLRELELAGKRGEMIPARDHEEAVISLCSGVALHMRGLPTKAAPEIRLAPTDLEAEELLRRFIDEALTELADAGEELQRRAKRRRNRDEAGGAGTA